MDKNKNNERSEIRTLPYTLLKSWKHVLIVGFSIEEIDSAHANPWSHYERHIGDRSPIYCVVNIEEKCYTLYRKTQKTGPLTPIDDNDGIDIWKKFDELLEFHTTHREQLITKPQAGRRTWQVASWVKNRTLGIFCEPKASAQKRGNKLMW